jgi:hypothetical protein
MACSTCQSTNTTCGCKDIPLTTAPVYSCPPDIKCPDPTPCYETIQNTCVKQSTNYSIYNFGSYAGASGITLPAGASLENAFQALSLVSYNSNCIPVINLHASYVGVTAITINWENTGAETYEIGISENGVFFSNTTGLTTTSYTYSDLDPNTNYYFRIITSCNDGDDTSTSAIIIVKTLPGL